jgi:hypothetical protein
MWAPVNALHTLTVLSSENSVVSSVELSGRKVIALTSYPRPSNCEICRPVSVSKTLTEVTNLFIKFSYSPSLANSSASAINFPSGLTAEEVIPSPVLSTA